MIKEANDYTVLNAGSDSSAGEAMVLSDFDLGLVLGGNPSQVQGPDSQTRSSSESYPTPSPESSADSFINFILGGLEEGSGLLRIPFIESVLFPQRPIA